VGKLIDIYCELYDKGVKFFDWSIDFTKAVTIEKDGTYAVFIDSKAIGTVAEEAVLVAHEAGHIFTGATHKVSSRYDIIARHEVRADRWAIKKLITKDELEAEVHNGYREPWELAERFNVPQEFLEKAICYYRRQTVS